MILTRPAYFGRFACLQDKCPMTCCAGWEIAVDSETQKRWKQADAPYAQTAAASVKGGVFRMQDGACAHLENGLCRLHTELGEACTPLTCRRFPVFHHDFGGRVEEGLCLSCPAAAELIFDAPCELTQTVTDTPPSPNDIDPAQFLHLLKARGELLRLCQEGTGKKALLCALYRAVFGSMPDMAAPQASAAPFAMLKEKLNLLDYSAQNCRELYKESPSLPAVEFKNLFFYYIFRYFLLPALGECSERAMGRFLLTALLACDLAGRENAPAFAKEAEHCDENLRRLRTEERPFLSDAALQSIIAAYPADHA